MGNLSLSDSQHQEMANTIRFLAADAVQKANSGHPGMPMGMADVATVLFTQFLKYDPAHPNWPDRDRFVLSAGHGSMLLYALLYLTGYPDITLDEIKNFRQLGSKTAGHPEFGHAAGIETTTGPLGQGLGNAVGMAIAERHLNARFGDDLVDHYTYALAGDGCLMEGISHEAISLAGHLKLNKLIVLFDDNGISIDGPVSLSDSTDVVARFKAAQWNVISVDGHDRSAVAKAIAEAKKASAPTLVACKTTIGFGSPSKAGSEKSHGSPLGDDDIAGMRNALDWHYGPFEVPETSLSLWREAGTLNASDYAAWASRKADAQADIQDAFDSVQAGSIPSDLSDQIADVKKGFSESAPSVASRKVSEQVLDVVNAIVPQTLGGSADLTGSNNTKGKVISPLSAENYGGRYLHYGIREHGMAAAMNGLALHGGVIPYSGTFLVFSDYARPSMRLAALMNQRVIHVMTHDSIGLGEDGPTHQPVEHLAALRVIPNLNVYRPADAVETAECWEMALQTSETPSVIALSRQNLPTLRTSHTSDNLTARGAYELSAASGEAAVSLFATGSEVHLATAAQEKLEAQGIPTRVVSMPCWELFNQQDTDYKKQVLGATSVRIGVEAAACQGWEKYLGIDGAFIGMDGFGASAPAEDLYRHFGITVENIVATATSLVK